MKNACAKHAELPLGFYLQTTYTHYEVYLYIAFNLKGYSFETRNTYENIAVGSMYHYAILKSKFYNFRVLKYCDGGKHDCRKNKNKLENA